MQLADRQAKEQADRQAKDLADRQAKDLAERHSKELQEKEEKVAKLSTAQAVSLVQACLQSFLSADIVQYWQRKAIKNELIRRRFLAARKIQCAIRQMLARRRVTRVKAQRAEELEKRNFLIAQRAEDAEKLLLQQKLSEQIMYQITRTNEAEDERRAIESRRLAAIALLHRSALRIQCAYRCYNAKFMLQWKLKDRHNKLKARERADYAVASQKAAVKIQCAVRKFVATRKVQRRREDKQRVKAELRRAEAQRHAAATRIQCMYRCFNARFEANWRREDRRRVEAVVVFKKREEEQQAVRAVLEKEAQQKNHVRQRAAAITIQCAWRCYNAKFELMWRVEARAKRNAENAARRQGTMLAKLSQKVGRGYLDRKKLYLDRTLARNLAAQELLLAEYEADSVINQVLDTDVK